MIDWSTWTAPAWAVSDDAQAWFAGFLMAALVRIFRAGLKWFKRVGNDAGGGDGD